MTISLAALVRPNMSFSIAYYGAATILCAVTVAANGYFGMTLGATTTEKIIYAGASVAADVIKCSTVLMMMMLWRKRQFGLTCAAAVLGVTCLVWSIASAAGFALSSRDHTAAIYATTKVAHDGWTTTIQRAGQQLATVGHSRPPVVIEADLAGQLVPAAIWRRTAGCTELTRSESHAACAHVMALRQEMAAAQSATALEERITEARRHLAAAPVVGLTADPQVAGLAALVGAEELSLRRALALWLAVLVEVGSAFGFTLAGAATTNPPPAVPCTTTRRGAGPAGPAPSGVVSFAERDARRKRGRRPATQPAASLVRWAAQCVRRDPHGCTGARATYQAYCRWAEGAGVNAVTETKFGRFMTGNIAAKGGKKVERRQGAFYVGVGLIWEPDQQPVRMAA